MKILKSGKISKTSFKNIDKLDFTKCYDIGIDSKGILRLAIFNGNWKNAKFSHYEYYLVSIINDNYKLNTDYCSYKSIIHRFTIEVLQVINGSEKKVGDRFIKRGKNLYGNYHEIVSASSKTLEEKHNTKKILSCI